MMRRRGPGGTHIGSSTKCSNGVPAQSFARRALSFFHLASSTEFLGVVRITGTEAVSPDASLTLTFSRIS